jgi:hypothetical protein
MITTANAAPTKEHKNCKSSGCANTEERCLAISIERELFPVAHVDDRKLHDYPIPP